MLLSNLDPIRRFITPFNGDHIRMVELFYTDGVMAICEPPEVIEPLTLLHNNGVTDLIELIIERPTKVEMDHEEIVLPPGRWMVPLCIAVYWQMVIHERCMLQRFYFGREIKKALLRCGWYQSLGPVLLKYGRDGVRVTDSMSETDEDNDLNTLSEVGLIGGSIGNKAFNELGLGGR